ncbi:MAG TPA: hypothetical protein VF006_02420, partial [Longimicrobium sp.]
AIVESLPDERLEVIATDLQRVVGGQLGQMAGKRTAFQFQSQFWAGAMLVGTGVSAVVPPQGSETRVDYLLMNGTINYGVEVKRPEKRETAGKLLRDAASQLRRAKLEGAVIMDLSDCFQEFWHSADVPRGRTEAGFDEMASELSSMIFDEHARKIQPGFENVLALMLTIRSIHWYEGQEQPDLMLRSFYGSFNRGPRGTLRYHRGVWLRNLMQNGLESWGYVSTS